VLRVALVAFGVYAAIVVVARLGFRSFLYQAPRDAPRVSPAPPASLRSFTAKDGATANALVFPAPPGARTVVHFHGNAETIGAITGRAVELAGRGLGTVLVEYRGYGVSQACGKPTEEALYADAEAVLDGLAAEGTPPERVILFGWSLGTGVASEMGRRGKGGALVLVSPFTSMTALAGKIVPILPASLIVPDRFDTLSKAPSLHVPTLVVHGTSDALIPFEMGAAIAHAIDGATLRAVEGGGHNDLFDRDGKAIYDAIATLGAR
jgi:alpha-beta hydrolase superfamily lysophospholipase